MRKSPSSPTTWRRLAPLLAAVLLVLPVMTFAPSPAEAQRVIRRCNGLFDCMFGGSGNRAPPRRMERQPQRGTPTQRQPRRSQRPPRQQQQSRQPQRPARASARAPAPEPEIEKLDNARVVLVVGDFLGGGLAEGLEAAYEGSPGVRIVDRTNGSSGFVRDDYYDWNGRIGAILDEVDPQVVVAMIGSNDRQQLTVEGRRVDPRSDTWMKAYEQRVKTFASATRDRDIPLIWSGLPPFKSSSMSSDMLAFNDVYKRVVDDVGGTFVDIWEGFVDEKGNFVFNGPDMNGQPVRLRGSDGINLTRAARRKIAFYVEKPLNKVLGDATAPDIGKKEIEDLTDIDTPTAPQPSPDRTAPVSLNDPDLDGGNELLGAEPMRENEMAPETPGSAAPDQAELAAETTEVAPAGRADDFALPEPSAEGDGTTSAIAP